MRRIGFVHAESRENSAWLDPYLKERMQARRWVAGRDYLLLHAYCDWRLDRVDSVVAELRRNGADLIAIWGPDDLTVAVARAAKETPVVFNQAVAPLEVGLIDSYARPGRNLTGTTIFSGPEVMAKRIELLHALAPRVARLFWLWGSGSPATTTLGGGTYDLGAMVRRASESMGIDMRIRVVRDPADVEAALADAAAWNADALSAGGASVYAERERLIAFATRARLPTIFSVREYVRAGGLLSYGVPEAEYDTLTDRWVEQMIEVLRGTPAGSLPVQAPSRFELCINAATARRLGLTIAPSLLSRVDELIER